MPAFGGSKRKVQANLSPGRNPLLNKAVYVAARGERTEAVVGSEPDADSEWAWGSRQRLECGDLSPLCDRCAEWRRQAGALHTLARCFGVPLLAPSSGNLAVSAGPAQHAVAGRQTGDESCGWENPCAATDVPRTAVLLASDRGAGTPGRARLVPDFARPIELRHVAWNRKFDPATVNLTRTD